MIACAALLLVCEFMSPHPASEEVGTKTRHHELLDDYFALHDKAVFRNSLLHTPEAKAIIEEGLAILPMLMEQYASTGNESFVLHGDVHMMLGHFSGIYPYFYSTSPNERYGVDYLERDLEGLPALARDWGESRLPQDRRDEYIAWWEFVQRADDHAERLTRMRAATGDVDAMAENLTSRQWRAYQRAQWRRESRQSAAAPRRAP